MQEAKYEKTPLSLANETDVSKKYFCLIHVLPVT